MHAAVAHGPLVTKKGDPVPWEERNRRNYYYKAARIDGRPRRIYLGHGPAGRIHEILDRRQKRERMALREELRARKSESAEQNRLWRQIQSWLEPLVAAEMTLAGFYKHRGQWRKAVMDPRMRQHEAPAPPPGLPAELRELESYRARVNAREPGAERELCRYLRDHPELHRQLGDLSRITTQLSLNKLAVGDESQAAIYRMNIDEWRRELLGPNPTAIERSLVEVAVSAKLALVRAELDAASSSPTHAIAAQKARTLERAQFRLAATLKKLQEVRLAWGIRSEPDEPPARPRPPAVKAS
jgi:hypothetical protein